MSRRKQGRPQQRKATDSLEQENDLLVCGDCQANFPLRDILRFIRHKVQRCNKENVDLLDGVDFEEDEPDPESASLPCIGTKRPSISAPIARKESIESRPSPRPSVDSQKDLPPEEKPPPQQSPPSQQQASMVTDDEDSRIDVVERVPLQPKQVVDAESNTTLSEPSKFVCENCKSTFNSAWTLLQHAQKEHGMKIYTTPPPQLDISTPSPRPSTEHRTPPSVVSSGPESPFPHPSPFQPFRLPLDNIQPPQHGSPLHMNSPLSPFSRPPHGMEFPIEFIGEHPFRIRPNLLPMPPGLDHPPPPPPPFSHPAFERSRPIIDSHMDFYSKRLQQLAHANPVMQKAGPPLSQAASVLTSMHQQQQLHQHEQQQLRNSPQVRAHSPQSSQPPPPSSNSSSESISRQHSNSSTKALPNKACEFCGKTFRFQSNLIVHRRSHTGEKPFKCLLCPHACTQQSKLKRHMKTHTNKSSLSGMSNASTDGSVFSSSSTPESNRNSLLKMEDGNDEDDEDEDEEDEEDDEDEEELMDEDLGEEDIEAMNEEAEEDRREQMNQVKKRHSELHGDKQHPEDASINDGDSRSNDNHSIDDRSVDNPSNCSDHDQGSTDGNYVNHNGAPSGTGSPEPKDKPQTSSLLKEVMEKTGLQEIQQYNDAFRQALEENNYKHDSSKDSDTEKEKEENGRSSSEDLKQDYSPPQMSPSERFPHHPLHSPFSYTSSASGPSPLSEMHLKQGIKREPVSEHLNNMEAAMYSRFWYPPASPLRDIYPTFNPFGLHRDLGRDQNGFTSAAAESALKALSMPKPGPSTPSSPMNGSALLRKDRRNDTCEFCGKVFKNCSNLTVHRRSHTGEKPYKCGLCNYACAQSSKLTRHMKTHGRSGKDVFRCKFCSMPFSVPSTLEKHMRKCVESRHARLHMSERERNGPLPNGSDSRSGLMMDIENRPEGMNDLDGRSSGLLNDGMFSSMAEGRPGIMGELEGRRPGFPDFENHRPVGIMGDIETSDTSSTTASNL